MFGLIVSVPIIVWGSQFVLKLMDRFPIVIVAGAALLGWISGDMIAHDVALKERVATLLPGLWVYAAPVTGALLVVVIGKLLAARHPAAPAAAGPIDLARRDDE